MIIFCRHYMSQANVDNIVQTYTNNSILPIPEQTILDWNENLPIDFNEDEVWVSQLKRTKETAEELTGYFDYVSAFVNEMPLYAVEGKPVIVDGSHFPMDDSIKDDIFSTQQNVLSFYESLDKDKDIIVFSHGITMRLLYYGLMKIPLPEHFPDIFKMNVAPLSMMVFDKSPTNSITCTQIHTTKDPIQYESK